MSEIKTIDNLSIIVAINENGVIGNVVNGEYAIPWGFIKEDMNNFKNTTIDNTILMGYKTFISIGKPLKNRTNIVLSRQANVHTQEGINLFNDLYNALEFAQSLNKKIYSIGGGEIYAQTLPLASELLISHIKNKNDGNIKFPEYDKSEWKEIDSDRKEFEQFTFSKYVRIK